jgi:hypothetical protein
VPEQSEIARQCQGTTVVVYTVSKQYVKKELERRVLNRKKRKSPPVATKVSGAILEKKSKVELGVNGRTAPYTLNLTHKNGKGYLEKHWFGDCTFSGNPGKAKS